MRKVEAAIEITRPASKIFEAFTEPSLLRSWWGVESCLIEKKQGGLYSLAWEASSKGFHYVSTGIITVFIPGREYWLTILCISIPINPSWVLPGYL